jgi:hypothetical protein
LQLAGVELKEEIHLCGGGLGPAAEAQAVRQHGRKLMNHPLRGIAVALISVLAAACKDAPQRELPAPEISQAVAAATAESPRPEGLACPTNPPQFKDYPVDFVFRGVPKWPIALGPDSNDLANRAEGALAYVKDHTPDFAGHLHVVESGCGAPCQTQQLVDVQTGQLVGSTITSLGAAYRVDSRLFIANPMDSTGCYSESCAYCRPRYFLWNGQGLDSIW